MQVVGALSRLVEGAVEEAGHQTFLEVEVEVVEGRRKKALEVVEVVDPLSLVAVVSVVQIGVVVAEEYCLEWEVEEARQTASVATVVVRRNRVMVVEEVQVHVLAEGVERWIDVGHQRQEPCGRQRVKILRRRKGPSLVVGEVEVQDVRDYFHLRMLGIC